MSRKGNLASVNNFASLVAFLRDDLDWPIDGTLAPEDLTFDYDPEELGLDTKAAVKVKTVRQIRPLSPRQSWGIFYIEFEHKQIPIVVLRRILSSLVAKKRQSANKSLQATWNMRDLLFVSACGETDERSITFAHFSEDPQFDLPTLRVLGWDGSDTVLKLEHVEATLRDKLHWPESGADLAEWREQWSSAFRHRQGHTIKTSEALAERLAQLARSIRQSALSIMKRESDKGPLRRLQKAFQTALINDLGADEFADYYAQTITYGLLTAAISRTDRDATDGRYSTSLVSDNVADMVPVTNPFLKEMLEAFLKAGGRKGGIDFDELGVQDVVELLRGDETDLPAILRDFGSRKPGEDPVIHFYEHFLEAYDKKLKVERGVFYTPQSVVSYIVRGVHEMLKTEFGLEDGLASVVTWGEVEKRPGVKIPDGVSRDSHFVQILDPATGTGTFLVETIDVIYKTLVSSWKKKGWSESQQNHEWNAYVPKHLLPRLYGYELMMAPYAIAHMKIGLKLFETGYKFASKERSRVYLTNALEAPSDINPQLPGLSPALAREALAVNSIKRYQRFTVVIGNPPYAGISSNMSEYAQSLVDPYRLADGKPLNERKLWLQDDYVKFMRIAQMLIEQSGAGIWGYITNHGYLDNPTFRGVRQSLMKTFQTLVFIDLHGNTNKKEIAPDGTEDKNVFEIRQGVGLCLAIRFSQSPRILHRDLWGPRQSKYDWLLTHTVNQSELSTIVPAPPFYFFKPQDTPLRQEYERWPKITEVMPSFGLGFQTSRDDLVVALTPSELEKRIEQFVNLKRPDSEVRAEFFPDKKVADYAAGDTRQWSLSSARRLLAQDSTWKKSIRNCLYRPFDWRWILYDPRMVDWPRPEIMGHMLTPNLCLIANRQSKEEFAVLCADTLTERKIAAVYDASSSFPLHLHSNTSAGQRSLAFESGGSLNFSHEFLKRLSEALSLPQARGSGLPGDFVAEDVFKYLYATFYSPSYRIRYRELLKVDFPRLPIPSSKNLFERLTGFGDDLVNAHLMRSSAVSNSIGTYIESGKDEVEKISYSKATIWIDKERTSGFSNVPETVWNFHVGGYQVCEKWLKDRKGRRLSKGDIEHYQEVLSVLKRTERIMSEIDETIEKYGGWPKAFS